MYLKKLVLLLIGVYIQQLVNIANNILQVKS